MTGAKHLLGRLVEGLVKGLEWFLIAAFLLLTLDVLWGVFSRYLLGAQSRWTEELAIYLLVWISLLGASVTYAERGHLGVDYFVGKLDPSAQRVGAVAVELLVLAFAGFALIYGGYALVVDRPGSLQVHQRQSGSPRRRRTAVRHGRAADGLRAAGHHGCPRRWRRVRSAGAGSR
jgi:TRAP-type mannitol/chloroaromatic compound transport system permease small subunit